MSSCSSIFMAGRRRLEAGSVHRHKLILSGATDGADPPRGQFFKRGAGGDAVIRITLLGIIDITTDLTLMFLHGRLLSQCDQQLLSRRSKSGPAAKESR